MALVLSGCVNYAGLDHRQQMVHAAHAMPIMGASLPAASWPANDWWKRFDDPELDRLIDQAWQHNPDLQQVQARTDKANAFVQLRDADRGPQLDAQAGVSRSRLSRSEDYDGEVGRHLTLRSLGVSFGYDLDLWGGRRAAYEAAVDQVHASQLDLQAARLLLTANVVKAYNQMAYAGSMVALSERDLDRLRKLEALTRDRYRSGLDNLSQVQRVEGLRARGEATLLGARSDVDIARLQLSALLGGSEAAQHLEHVRPLKPDLAALPADLPAELLGRRPDIVAARWRVQAGMRSADAVKTRFYPNVNLGASAGLRALAGDSFTEGASRYWSVAPTVSLPIFDAGHLRGTLRDSNADLDLAIARYNSVVNTAVHEVASAVTRLQSTNRQDLLQRSARDIAQSSFELSAARYKAGEDNFLDSLTIEQQLIDDELRLALLKSRQIDNAVDLITALGGGFQASVD